jgi:hypothetical protein
LPTTCSLGLGSGSESLYDCLHLAGASTARLSHFHWTPVLTTMIKQDHLPLQPCDQTPRAKQTFHSGTAAAPRSRHEQSCNCSPTVLTAKLTAQVICLPSWTQLQQKATSASLLLSLYACCSCNRVWFPSLPCSKPFAASFSVVECAATSSQRADHRA